MDIITRKYEIDGRQFKEELVTMVSVIEAAEEAMVTMESLKGLGDDNLMANITKSSICHQLGLSTSDKLLDKYKTKHVEEGIGSAIANAIKTIWKKITGFFGKIFGASKEDEEKAGKAKKKLKKHRDAVLKAIKKEDINISQGIRKNPLKDYRALWDILLLIRKGDKVSKDLFGKSISISKGRISNTIRIKSIPISGTKLNDKPDEYIYQYAMDHLNLIEESHKLNKKILALSKRGGHTDSGVERDVTKITAKVISGLGNSLSSPMSVARKLVNIIKDVENSGKVDKPEKKKGKKKKGSK